MKFTAMLLLVTGTIAASVALAPIPRMTRLFEADLTAVSQEVTDAVDALEKEGKVKGLAAIKGSMKLLWVSPKTRAERMASDLEAVHKKLTEDNRESMAENVAKAQKSNAKVLAALSLGPDVSKEDKAKALSDAQGPNNQRLSMLERQLKENLRGSYPEEFTFLQVLGRNTTDRRKYLGDDLEQLKGILGTQGTEVLGQAQDKLAKFDAAFGKRKAQDANRWGNPIWWLFTLGSIAMLAGIMINRKLTKQAAEAEAETARTTGGDIGKNIRDLVSGVDTLVNKLETLDDAELHRELDRIVTGPMFDLTENRMVLQTVLGIQQYAFAMSILASTERSLNRAWCALTDGYGPEARKSVKAGQSSLSEFHSLVSEKVAGTTA